MKYCKNGIKGGCWHELQKGDFAARCYPDYWHTDSLFIDDDIFQELGLYYLFAEVMPRFDNYGVNRIEPADWDRIKEVSGKYDKRVREFVQEVDVWAQNCFDTEPCFYFLGV